MGFIVDILGRRVRKRVQARSETLVESFDLPVDKTLLLRLIERSAYRAVRVRHVKVRGRRKFRSIP